MFFEEKDKDAGHKVRGIKIFSSYSSHFSGSNFFEMKICVHKRKGDTKNK